MTELSCLRLSASSIAASEACDRVCVFTRRSEARLEASHAKSAGLRRSRPRRCNLPDATHSSRTLSSHRLPISPRTERSTRASERQGWQTSRTTSRSSSDVVHSTVGSSPGVPSRSFACRATLPTSIRQRTSPLSLHDQSNERPSTLRSTRATGRLDRRMILRTRASRRCTRIWVKISSIILLAGTTPPYSRVRARARG